MPQNIAQSKKMKRETKICDIDTKIQVPAKMQEWKGNIMVWACIVQAWKVLQLMKTGNESTGFNDNSFEAVDVAQTRQRLGLSPIWRKERVQSVAVGSNLWHILLWTISAYQWRRREWRNYHWYQKSCIGWTHQEGYSFKSLHTCWYQTMEYMK